jgi:hypothetical protein
MGWLQTFQRLQFPKFIANPPHILVSNDNPPYSVATFPINPYSTMDAFGDQL